MIPGEDHDAGGVGGAVLFAYAAADAAAAYFYSADIIQTQRGIADGAMLDADIAPVRVVAANAAVKIDLCCTHVDQCGDGQVL